jgi:2-polyprenyl-3-methyl-5-hydroxy-6-metoxy-1,4-benzoquinol methylase
MELQKRDNVKTLVECWKRTTDNALNLQDEDKMTDFWNKRSNSYSNNIDKDERKKKTDEILEFLKESGFNPEGSKVLDIGCGPGTLTIPLAKIGVEVTALDISSGMLNRFF